MTSLLNDYKPTAESEGLVNDHEKCERLAKGLVAHLSDCGVAEARHLIKRGGRNYEVIVTLISVDDRETLN